MRSVRIALTLAGMLTALALALTLLGAPMSVAGTNGIPDAGEVATTKRNTSACQAGETVPAGTTAVRLTLAAEIGPRVMLRASSAGRTVTTGVRGAGWTGAAVTVPVRRVRASASHVELCFALARPLEVVELFGRHTVGAESLVGPHGRRLPGRLGVEYLRTGSASWLSLIPKVAEHMGFGHGFGGTWIAFALAVAMACVAAVVIGLAASELRPGGQR
jgi:hypothetical protein